MNTALAVVTTGWGLVMGLAPLLQVRLILRTGESSGTSLGWVMILLVGFSLWFSYGVVNGDKPIIISNSVALTVTIVLFVVTLRYRRNGKAEA